MTRESAGFFARLFGKRKVAGQSVAPENALAPQKEAQNVAPEVAASTAASLQALQQDDAAHSGEEIENPEIDNLAEEKTEPRTSEASDAANEALDAEASPDDVAQVETKSSKEDLAESADSVEIPPASPKTKVVTVLSLVPHAGLETLCAALEDRFEDQDILVRSAGPGLMRAAFAGALSGSDALVMVAPADPEVTSEFSEKLSWLEANGRTRLVEQSIFVVNYGSTGEGQALALPADLERPVVMLPFDNALSLPAIIRRAPRRAARHAISQIVEELNLILNPA